MITETLNKSSSSQETKVRYQGRKASRAGSEQRRKQILEASLRIIVREGLRGVRHRSVAKEANVPLAATTYYFKDIGELITDTFTHYVELALERVALLRGLPIENHTQTIVNPSEVGTSTHDVVSAVFPNTHVVSNSEQIETGDVAVSKPMRFNVEAVDSPESLASLLVEFVVNELVSGKDLLIAAQAFRHEALLNSHLRPMAQQYDQAFLKELQNLLAKANIENTQLGAEILFNTMTRVEYEALLKDVTGDDLKDLAANAINARMGLLTVTSV